MNFVDEIALLRAEEAEVRCSHHLLFRFVSLISSFLVSLISSHLIASHLSHLISYHPISSHLVSSRLISSLLFRKSTFLPSPLSLLVIWAVTHASSTRAPSLRKLENAVEFSLSKQTTDSALMRAPPSSVLTVSISLLFSSLLASSLFSFLSSLFSFLFSLLFTSLSLKVLWDPRARRRDQS
jgi:hypothetical protein